MEPEDVKKELTAEQERLRQLIIKYEDLGTAGIYGIVRMKSALERAANAQSCGILSGMKDCLKRLKTFN